MAETKTKAFRADEKTISRINTWMENNGIGNSEALERMADIIDMSEAKGALAGRSTEISNFESLVHQLTTAYTASLQLAQNAEARIRSEFAKRLTSQDETIADLQARAKKLTEEANAAKNDANDAMRELDGLQREYDGKVNELVAARTTAQKAQDAAQVARTQADRLTALTGDQAEEIRTLKASAAEAEHSASRLQISRTPSPEPKRTLRGPQDAPRRSWPMNWKKLQHASGRCPQG